MSRSFATSLLKKFLAALFSAAFAAFLVLHTALLFANLPSELPGYLALLLLSFMVILLIGLPTVLFLLILRILVWRLYPFWLRYPNLLMTAFALVGLGLATGTLYLAFGSRADSDTFFPALLLSGAIGGVVAGIILGQDKRN